MCLAGLGVGLCYAISHSRTPPRPAPSPRCDVGTGAWRQPTARIRRSIQHLRVTQYHTQRILGMPLIPVRHLVCGREQQQLLPSRSWALLLPAGQVIRARPTPSCCPAPAVWRRATWTSSTAWRCVTRLTKVSDATQLRPLSLLWKSTADNVGAVTT